MPVRALRPEFVGEWLTKLTGESESINARQGIKTDGVALFRNPAQSQNQ